MKKNVFIIVIVLMLFLIGFVLYKNNNNSYGKKETITLVEKIFGINIQDYEFEYENKLKKNKYEGCLTVKLNVNADQLKEILNKWVISQFGFKRSTWPDDADYITVASNRLGLDVKEGALYSRMTEVKRKITFAFKPNQHKAFTSFVYFLENDDSSTTIYMNYEE